MGIEEKLEEEDSPRGVEKKRTWRRRLARLLEKNSTENSMGIGLLFSGILTYTYFRTGAIRENLPRIALGGMLSATEVKIGIEWVVNLLMREKEGSEETEETLPQRSSFFERYWHMIPGAGMGILLGKTLTQRLGDRLQDIHTAILASPSDMDYHLLYATTIVDIALIYGTQLVTSLAGATFLRVAATKIPLSYVVADLYAKTLIFLGRTDEAVKIYQRLERTGTPQSTGSARSSLARIQKTTKDQGGFMLSIRDLIDKTIRLRNTMGFDPLTVALFRERIARAKRTKEKRPSLTASLDLTYAYADQGYYTLSDELMEETARRYPAPEVRLLHTIYRETRGEHSTHFNEEKRRALVDVLKEGERQKAFQQQGEHRNEVLFYKPEQSVFLAGTLVYKRNPDPTGLQIEEANLRFLRSRLGNRVVRVLDAFQDTGFQYLALLYAGDRTLADNAPKPGQEQDKYVEQVRKCLDLLVEIQYVMEVNIDTIALDPVGQREESYFTNRLRDIFFGQLKQHGTTVDPDAEEVVMRVHGYINDELRALPRDQLAFYTDANPGNWFIDEQGRITRGDLESNRLLPIYFDLLLLFDFLGETLGERDRGELEFHYLKARARRFGTPIDHQAFGRMKRIAGYHKHLEQAGYKARDAELSRRAGKDPQEHHTVAHYHLERAGHCLDQMGYYHDVPRQHHTLLSDARFALAGMLINVQ